MSETYLEARARLLANPPENGEWIDMVAAYENAALINAKVSAAGELMGLTDADLAIGRKFVRAMLDANDNPA